MKSKKNLLLKILLVAYLYQEPALSGQAFTVRLKDIINVEGVRENQLVGYGLVVGLNGTGDSSSPFTNESLISMLERLGVNVRGANISAKNVAAVMVTATLPPFARHGARIDVTVSAMGDAKDLKGGTLLVTPMMGADGEVYAVGQGPLSSSGIAAAGASGSQITKGVPTSATISNGAIVEKEIPFDFGKMDTIRLSLKNPDFTTAKRVSNRINRHLHKADASRAMDPSTILVNLPKRYKGNMVNFITDIEHLRVQPDQVAKIIIDDKDGVIVMGQNVRISTVAVTHGSITIQISETPQVSQPNPFTQVQTATVVPRTDIDIKEEKGKMAILKAGVTLGELVHALNALGATPRDLITILRSIKAAGALQADIEVI